MLFIAVTLNACSGMFFYPMSQLVRTPADISLEYEDLYFTSQDGVQLHGWFLPAVGEAKGTVIFYHGNAENISTHIAAVYWLPKEGYNTFIFDYRGYGLSQGETEIDGVHQDGLAALRFIARYPKVDPDKLVVFGQSLGGAIAIYSVAHAGVPVKALIIESSFADYRTIFQEKLAGIFFTWPLQWPLSFAVTNQYSPLVQLPWLKDVPLLVVHGDADQIVPIHHGRQLFEAASGDKTFWQVEGGDHTAAFTYQRQRYGPRLLEYLQQKLGPINPH
jgi:hypothetical protein